MKIIFEVHPSYSYFYPKTNEIYTYLDGILSFRPKNYWFMTSYRVGRWDGWFKFRQRNRIPTGLLFSLVIPNMRRMGIEYEVDYKYDNLAYNDQSLELNNIELRNYQTELIKLALCARRGILQLPTNAGKTEVACAIIKAFGEHFLFVTHLKELFYQTHKRIKERLGIDAGRIGDGLNEYSESGNIVMVQTLSNLDAKQRDMIVNSPVLIVDEVHHYHGQRSIWYKMMMQSKAVVRFGLSATPMRDDEISDWQLKAMTGLVFGDITNKELIDKGYSTPPEIHMIETDIFDISCAGRYQEQYDSLVHSEKRNKVIKKLVEGVNGNKQVLILVDRIEHGKELMKYINNSTFLCGTDTTERRQSIINDFTERKLNKVLITTLLGEGVDIPSIDVLVFASPMKSQIKVLQRIGRGMRKDKSKDKVIVFDLVDTWSWYFHKQAKARYRLYNKEQFVVIKEKYEGIEEKKN